MPISDEKFLPSNIDAKPCPWCNTTEHLEIANNGDEYFVRCDHCWSSGPVPEDENDNASRHAAVQRWNARA